MTNPTARGLHRPRNTGYGGILLNLPALFRL